MTGQSRSGFRRLTQRLIDEGVLASRCDADLLERFATERDPEAFAVIVARHGPTVAAVCRGILGPAGDVDDLFQATFLVLLNRAGTLSAGQ
jgi:DNA-directed RNA polymerase specialized sigma24 family protein